MHSAWTHPGSFATWHAARAKRVEKLREEHRRWDEEHERLKELVRTLQQQAKYYESMAPKYRVMAARLQRFEEAGPPPEIPVDEKVTPRLRAAAPACARSRARSWS
ncbi:ABC transporter [Lentzea xinjiangensis]|uniref:ABC transporter n=1 Tax=Lentzea xinjiangensis TaxID=402600 RepID=A0A1H9N7H0_9PSEU|nr:ABC transporter [Lentzea xinjiangensis]